MTATKPQYPRDFTDSELKKVGVEIVEARGVWLRCMECDNVWSPNIQTGGKLPRGYWKCPHYECNVL
jgi:hypothetical protein